MSRKNNSAPSNPLSAIAVFFVIALLAASYVMAGLDPMGLFAQVEAPVVTQPVVTQNQTATPMVGPRPTFTPAPSGGSMSGSGDWWKVYFTDPNRINNPADLSGSVTEKLIAYINLAQTSIDIAAFEFNLTPVAEALIAAHERGVRIRWVTDDEYGIDADAEAGRGQFAMLENAGIEVRDDGRSALMHDKFWIFDNQTVWTGSTNVTINDHFRNNNNVIVIDSPKVAEVYAREFAEMWNGQLGPDSPSDLAAQQPIVGRTLIRILFSPEDKALNELVLLISGAQQSIRFMAFSYTHDALTEAMLERAAAGVDVGGIFETRASETQYSALPELYCSHLAVRQDGNPGTFHHKVIVIDNKIIVTGSLNFSENADSANSENTMIIPSVTMAKLYLQEFDRRWVEATEPDPAKMNCR